MKKYLLALSVLFVFTACQKKEEKKEEVKESIKTVFAIYPKEKLASQNRVFNALASSNHQTNLSFKVQGNVNNFKIKIGDEVKKGQVIAKLDAKPYELRVSQARYALSEAKASLQNAKSTYERTKKLYINQNASVSDIDNAKASYNAADAKVHNVTEELAYAKLQLSYTKLYAPMDGYISVKYIQENENVAVGNPIVLLSDKLVDEVKVQVPESFINKIKKDDLVRVVFNSLDNKAFAGFISEVSKFASSNAKTYEVVVKIKDSSKLIKSGMSADVYFSTSLENSKDILCVPSNAVLNEDEGYFVYVLKKDVNNYIVKKRKVKVGSLTNKGYEIYEGLDKNDLVLKAGMSEVYVDMKVLIGNLKDLGN